VPAILEPSAPLPRRGFLRGLLALAPAAAIATAAAAPAASATLQRENWKLLRLGEQLEAIDLAFTAAMARKAETRAAANGQWPLPPAEITFAPGEREPSWCAVQLERDIDDKPFYFFGTRNTARKVADAFQLQTYVDQAPRKGANKEARAAAKEARRLLGAARDYEAARKAVIESTGYGEAKEKLRATADRIDRVAELIYKCEARTYIGLAIKARALVIAFKAGGVDCYISTRAGGLYAGQLADSVLALASPGSSQS
jgi:hypothetical protein